VFIQPYSVRHEYPFRATYSRGVLRHVAGFPDLRLLCPIRHPSTLALASLPDRSLFLDSTRAHTVSRVHYPFRVPTLPVSSRHFGSGAFGASWVPRRISSRMPQPDDSAGPPHPRLGTDASVLPSVHVKTLGDPELSLSKLYQHFRERGLPYGLQDALSMLTSPLVRGLPRSSLRSRLDTGGWLALTRQGLSPRKIRRASPSVITLTECKVGVLFRPTSITHSVTLNSSRFSFSATQRLTGWMGVSSVTLPRTAHA
jgi:hypothetical protein